MAFIEHSIQIPANATWRPATHSNVALKDILTTEQSRFITDEISFWLGVEEAISTAGKGYLFSRVVQGEALEAFFDPDPLVFGEQLTPVFTGTSYNSVLPVAARSYKYHPMNSEPLYLRVIVGFRGVGGADTGNREVTRPHVSVAIYSDAGFSTLLHTFEGSISTPIGTYTTGTVGGSWVATGGYTLTGESLVLFPMANMTAIAVSSTTNRLLGWHVNKMSVSGFTSILRGLILTPIHEYSVTDTPAKYAGFVAQANFSCTQISSSFATFEGTSITTPVCGYKGFSSGVRPGTPGFEEGTNTAVARPRGVTMPFTMLRNSGVFFTPPELCLISDPAPTSFSPLRADVQYMGEVRSVLYTPWFSPMHSTASYAGSSLEVGVFLDE